MVSGRISKIIGAVRGMFSRNIAKPSQPAPYQPKPIAFTVPPQPPIAKPNRPSRSGVLTSRPKSRRARQRRQLALYTYLRLNRGLR